MAKTAPEIIGFHLGWDMAEVSDARYQSTRFSSPGVYTCPHDYFCAPTAKQKPPKGFAWKEVGEHYGRKVYRADPSAETE
jgi:hypothetical protein